MKICIVTPIIFPEPGGPSTFVEYFSRDLKKDNHEVTIVAINESDGILTKEDYCLISIKRRGLKVCRVLKTIFAIVRYGRKNEIVISCGLFFECAVAKFMIKKPLIIRIGGDPVWEKWTNQKGVIPDLKEFQISRYSLGTEVKKYLQRMSCRFADKMMTPSYFFKHIVETWGVSPQKIEVVYNGIDEEEINLPPKEELKKKYSLEDKKVILTIGRLIQYKRIDGIIESFSQIKENNLYLVVIGEGYKKEELSGLSQRLNLSERVKLLGARSHNEVLEYMKAADIFVLNSVDEVMPNVVLESLAVGTPVVAPNAGGIPEIIQGEVDGLLYPLRKNNRHELKEAMERLLRDDELKKQFMKNGLIKADKFSWKKTYEKTLLMINSV